MTPGKGSYVTSRPPYARGVDWTFEVYVEGMGETRYFPEWQRALFTRIMDGTRWHYRDLAAELGRARATIESAIARWVDLGILVSYQGIRGRLGYTSCKLARDVMEATMRRARLAAVALGHRIARDMVVRLPGTTPHLKIDGEYRGPP